MTDGSSRLVGRSEEPGPAAVFPVCPWSCFHPRLRHRTSESNHTPLNTGVYMCEHTCSYTHTHTSSTHKYETHSHKTNTHNLIPRSPGPGPQRTQTTCDHQGACDVTPWLAAGMKVPPLPPPVQVAACPQRRKHKQRKPASPEPGSCALMEFIPLSALY